MRIFVILVLFVRQAIQSEVCFSSRVHDVRIISQFFLKQVALSPEAEARYMDRSTFYEIIWNPFYGNL